MNLMIGLFALILTSLGLVSGTSHYSLIYGSNGQLVTSSTLVWQTYSGEPKQLEFAVKGAEISTNEESYKMYICSALIEGIWTVGHTEQHQGRTVCIVGVHAEAKIHHSFDVLINKNKMGRLSWKPWNKYSGRIPTGAVSSVQTGHVSIYLTQHYVCQFIIM